MVTRLVKGPRQTMAGAPSFLQVVRRTCPGEPVHVFGAEIGLKSVFGAEIGLKSVFGNGMHKKS